ncbi:unnamed protein product [Amoebophrya sp. A25]|nr:unnamed protein product [Amoebophrya sp. A25]|eukprot:GSA25T00008519001.1
MANSVVKSRSRNLKVKAHRTKQPKLVRKMSRNGRSLAANSPKNVQNCSVDLTTTRTLDNSEKLVNAIRKAKKQQKRVNYRAEKKAARRAKGAEKASALKENSASATTEAMATEEVSMKTVRKKKKTSAAVKKLVASMKNDEPQAMEM